MTDPHTIEFTPAIGQRRKVEFERLDADTWVRRTYRWTGCNWRREGAEPVTDVVLPEAIEA